MQRSWIAASCVSLLGVAACDDGKAEDQCVALLETVCKRSRECAEELSGEMAPSGFEKECLDAAMQGLGGKNCKDAVSVSSSYDTCIDQLNDVECNKLLVQDDAGAVMLKLPDSCAKVIQVK